MGRQIEVNRTSGACEYCDKEKDCFEFEVYDESGKLLRRVKQCADCIERLFIRVISLMPVAIILPIVAKSHILIMM